LTAFGLSAENSDEHVKAMEWSDTFLAGNDLRISDYGTKKPRNDSDLREFSTRKIDH